VELEKSRTINFQRNTFSWMKKIFSSSAETSIFYGQLAASAGRIATWDKFPDRAPV
jgi:hypothetical protein